MTSQLFAFAGVCVLITLVPGLDTALVTRNVLLLCSGYLTRG